MLRPALPEDIDLAAGASSKCVAVKAVHVSLSGEAAIRLTVEAKRRSVSPQMLAVALLNVVLGQDLTENVLDGDDPRVIAAGKMRCGNDLTHLRCGVLYVLALHANREHVTKLSASRISVLLDAAGSGTVSKALAALAARGLIERHGQRTPGDAQAWRLTREGLTVAADLGDLGDLGFGPDFAGGTA